MACQGQIKLLRMNLLQGLDEPPLMYSWKILVTSMLEERDHISLSQFAGPGKYEATFSRRVGKCWMISNGIAPPLFQKSEKDPDKFIPMLSRIFKELIKGSPNQLALQKFREELVPGNHLDSTRSSS